MNPEGARGPADVVAVLFEHLLDELTFQPFEGLFLPGAKRVPAVGFGARDDGLR